MATLTDPDDPFAGPVTVPSGRPTVDMGVSADEQAHHVQRAAKRETLIEAAVEAAFDLLIGKLEIGVPITKQLRTRRVQTTLILGEGKDVELRVVSSSNMLSRTHLTHAVRKRVADPHPLVELMELYTEQLHLGHVVVVEERRQGDRNLLHALAFPEGIAQDVMEALKRRVSKHNRQIQRDGRRSLEAPAPPRRGHSTPKQRLSPQDVARRKKERQRKRTEARLKKEADRAKKRR